MFNTPYAAPEHRKALGGRPAGVAQDVGNCPPRQESRGTAWGPKAAERRKSAASGGVLSLVAFFARAKKATHGSGAEHPRLKQIAAEGGSTHARSAPYFSPANASINSCMSFGTDAAHCMASPVTG